MLSKYKHLDNGITVIYLEKTNVKKVQEAYIDTVDFDLIDNATKEYWRIWNGGAGVYFKRPNRKRPTFLKHLVTAGVNQDVYHANGNPFDFRSLNLIEAPKGSNMKASFKGKLKKISDSLPPTYENIIPKYVEDNLLIEMYNQLDKSIE